MTWDKLGKINVLIVDDDEFNRQLVISLLSSISSINFIEASNGVDALEILKQTSIDMVLLDLHMPKLDGYETLLEIKKEPNYKYVPVAILTTDEQEKRKLYELGADDFLSKPYNLYELESRIYFHIETQQKEKLKHREVSKKPKVIQNPEAKTKIQTYSIASIEQSQKEFFYELTKLSCENETEQHRLQVIAQVTKSLAELVGYGKKIANDIAFASVVRNIGALSSSKATPSLKYVFSKEKQEAYIAYIVRSYHLLSTNIETEFVKITKKVILQQREHFDGSGFPKQRKGEEIHKVAYIVALAEMFHALLSDKDYHEKVHSNEETYLLLESLSGKRLHPQITELFLEHFEYFIELREKIMNKNINTTKETVNNEQ